MAAGSDLSRDEQNIPGNRVKYRQAKRVDTCIQWLEARDQRFFWLRLGSLLAGGLLTFIAFFFAPPVAAWSVLTVWVIVFVIIVALHRRLDRSLAKFRLARRLISAQIARANLDWANIPVTETTVDEIDGHPFADLNLVGARSLHQLVDTAITAGGSARLRSWLLEQELDTGVILSRQVLVKELVCQPGFRWRLDLTGMLALGAASKWDGGPLERWFAAMPPARSLNTILFILSSLSAVNILLLLLYALAGWPAIFIPTFLLYLTIYMARYRDFNDLFDNAYTMGHLLEPLSKILAVLETNPYRPGSRLAELCAPFVQCGQLPSAHLGRLSRIISAAALKNNTLIWAPVNAVVPWDMYFARRMNQLRESLRQCLPAWLDTWYEVEALSSLANFASLNPGYTFPAIVVEAGEPDQPVFHARELGHPLIPAGSRVCNDFTILRLGEVIIVTGSNMSGKSTFLRTLGINLRLAYTGAPVCARSLDTLLFRVFTSLNLSDSLNEGISYFYAEVRRLKELLDDLDRNAEAPLFFLIDEIFRGTNNRERQIGSRAYVQALAGKHGTGVISTHDLELARLEADLPGIRNVHFEEAVRDGRLVFDYRLRTGPSPTTNALKIMTMEGLPVGEPSDPD